MDIDWFKKVNDTFGHETGDEVLIEISEILLGLFEKDHVVRYGGEEFVIGLCIKDEKELKYQIDRLFGEIQHHPFSRQQLNISVSLGCCYTEDEKLTGWVLSGMLKAADRKLYEAKENGRKQYRIVKFDSSQRCEKGQN